MSKINEVVLNLTHNVNEDKKRTLGNQPLENVKSKYVLANTIKANKISTKLSKSLNNVVSDKTFIGYDETDYENVEKMCELCDYNLFVKNEF